MHGKVQRQKQGAAITRDAAASQRQRAIDSVGPREKVSKNTCARSASKNDDVGKRSKNVPPCARDSGPATKMLEANEADPNEWELELC